MLQQIKSYIEENELLRPNDKVIVGFSGGADSMALLHMLHAIGYQCVAAHCNFHLRGEESNRDEAFVRKVVKELNIPFLSIDFDTKTYAKENKISIEMAARELRYAWFEKIKQQEKAVAIAVAHHKDDLVETILINLIRGTGIKGLVGMYPKRGNVIRPLLMINRDEVIEYLQNNQLAHVEDSTNASDEYVRNFIRLRLIPLMEEINPSVKDAVASTGEYLWDVERIYRASVHELIESLLQQGKLSIPLLKKVEAPKAVLFEVLSPYGFTSSQIQNIFQSLDAESGKKFISPDKKTIVIKDRDAFIISEYFPRDTHVYHIDKESVDYPIGLKLCRVPIDVHFKLLKDENTAFLDADKISGKLYLRTWREGDWFIPLGMKGTKKLSDFFSDEKYSLKEKEQTWLLCDEENILWVVGKRIDNRYRIQETSKTALIVFFST